MKKTLVCLATLAVSAAFAQGPVVKPGDVGLKRESAPAPLVSVHPDRAPAPVVVAWTPFAVNVFSLSVPYGQHLEIDGVRLNLTVPFATPDHGNVFGLDLGLAGENDGHTGGIAINVFDNWSNSFSGGAVSLVNATGDLRGIQIGLVNIADSGSGVQIGLWNKSANYMGPIIGIVW